MVSTRKSNHLRRRRSDGDADGASPAASASTKTPSSAVASAATSSPGLLRKKRCGLPTDPVPPDPQPINRKRRGKSPISAAAARAKKQGIAAPDVPDAMGPGHSIEKEAPAATLGKRKDCQPESSAPPTGTKDDEGDGGSVEPASEPTPPRKKERSAGATAAAGAGGNTRRGRPKCAKCGVSGKLIRNPSRVALEGENLRRLELVWSSAGLDRDGGSAAIAAAAAERVRLRGEEMRELRRQVLMLTEENETLKSELEGAGAGGGLVVVADVTRVESMTGTEMKSESVPTSPLDISRHLDDKASHGAVATEVEASAMASRAISTTDADTESSKRTGSENSRKLNGDKSDSEAPPQGREGNESDSEVLSQDRKGDESNNELFHWNQKGGESDNEASLRIRIGDLEALLEKARREGESSEQKSVVVEKELKEVREALSKAEIERDESYTLTRSMLGVIEALRDEVCKLRSEGVDGGVVGARMGTSPTESCLVSSEDDVKRSLLFRLRDSEEERGRLSSRIEALEASVTLLRMEKAGLHRAVCSLSSSAFSSLPSTTGLFPAPAADAASAVAAAYVSRLRSDLASSRSAADRYAMLHRQAVDEMNGAVAAAHWAQNGLDAARTTVARLVAASIAEEERHRKLLTSNKTGRASVPISEGSGGVGQYYTGGHGYVNNEGDQEGGELPSSAAQAIRATRTARAAAVATERAEIMARRLGAGMQNVGMFASVAMTPSPASPSRGILPRTSGRSSPPVAPCVAAAFEDGERDASKAVDGERGATADDGSSKQASESEGAKGAAEAANATEREEKEIHGLVDDRNQVVVKTAATSGDKVEPAVVAADYRGVHKICSGQVEKGRGVSAVCAASPSSGATTSNALGTRAAVCSLSPDAAAGMSGESAIGQTESMCSAMAAQLQQDENELRITQEERINIHLWRQKFESLCHFYNRFGHVRVPTTWAEDPLLNCWVQIQKREYEKFRNGYPNFLVPEMAACLEAIGF